MLHVSGNSENVSRGTSRRSLFQSSFLWIVGQQVDESNWVLLKDITTCHTSATRTLELCTSIIRVGDNLHFMSDMAEFGELACLHEYRTHVHIELRWEYFTQKSGTIPKTWQHAIHGGQSHFSPATTLFSASSHLYEPRFCPEFRCCAYSFLQK